MDDAKDIVDKLLGEENDRKPVYGPDGKLSGYTSSKEQHAELDNLPQHAEFEPGVRYVLPDGFTAVCVDGVMRGSPTTFFVGKDRLLYYVGADPSYPSDGMAFSDPWDQAEQLTADDAEVTVSPDQTGVDKVAAEAPPVEWHDSPRKAR